jgi:hypothetical protein
MSENKEIEDLIKKISELKLTISDVQKILLELKEILKLLQTIVTTQQIKWDSNVIKWNAATGPSGEYQIATVEANQGNSNFDELLKDLDAHKGCMRRGGWFYWKFDQKQAVGRKKLK